MDTSSLTHNVRRRGSALVVGDDVALRGAIRLNLEGEGVEVYEIDSRTPTAALPAATKPDICIVDLHAPTPGEWARFGEIRGWPVLNGVPVLVVANEPPRADEVTVLPDAHLTKPFDASDLVRKVRRLLRKGK